MAGSLQYWPRRRARRRLPRVRNMPAQAEPVLSSMIAYKAGMVSLGVVDDSNAPTKGMEVMRAGTVLEIPRMEVYGIRLYKRDAESGYRHVSAEMLHRQTSERLGIKEVKADETKLADLRAKAGEYIDATALVAAYPKGMSTGQHHPMRFESAVGGKSVEEKLDTLSKLLGKELKASDIFKSGEYIDTTSITKGKGWQGAIKRFGASRQFHKATQKIRHVGPIGAFTPGKVLYSVPRAGQMGFNYRTEHGKRILKIGQKESVSEINPKSGFANYGQVRSDYLLIEGSVPGPAKRLVRLRKSITQQSAKGVSEPKLTFIKG